MKPHILRCSLFLVASFYGVCCAPCRAKNEKRSVNAERNIKQPEIRCYLAKVPGKEEEYSVIRLELYGNQVKGLLTYNYSGYIRSGKLEGVLKGDTIEAIWHHAIGDQQVKSDFKFLFEHQTKDLKQVSGSRPPLAEYRKTECLEAAFYFR